MERFEDASGYLSWLSTDLGPGIDSFDDLNDDIVASELVDLFGGELEVDEIYSDDLEFLDDEY